MNISHTSKIAFSENIQILLSQPTAYSFRNYYFVIELNNTIRNLFSRSVMYGHLNISRINIFGMIFYISGRKNSENHLPLLTPIPDHIFQKLISGFLLAKNLPSPFYPLCTMKNIFQHLTTSCLNYANHQHH